MIKRYFKRLKTEFKGYNAGKFGKDVLAGITVAAVALPLALAFGISSGATAAAGLITALIAGVVIGLLSGASYQISGPTGAMAAILCSLVATYQIQGVFIACFMSGAILLLCGIFKLGGLVQFIPTPVITGFTSGIAIIIAFGQINNLTGLKCDGASTIDKIVSYFNTPQTLNFEAIAIGVCVIVFMLIYPKKLNAIIPSSLMSTGAMAAILCSLVATYQIQGVFIACFMSGAILLLCGIFKLGGLVQFIPTPVITGFTSGIAIIIAFGQINNLTGLKCDGASTIDKIVSYFNTPQTLNFEAIAIGVCVIVFMLIYPKKLNAIIPSSLMSIIIATALNFIFNFNVGIVGEIPQTLLLNDRLDITAIDFDTVKNLIFPAISIAALGLIESLLCGASAGRMKNEKLDSDQELVAQGIGNMLIPFFGGVPATAAIARTSVAIKSGAQTRIAGVIHSLVLLASMFLLGGVMSKIPMAALAGVLIVTAWRMNEFAVIKDIFGRKIKTAMFQYLITMAATVIFDLTVAIIIGILFSVIMFVLKVSDMTVNVADVDPAKIDIADKDGKLCGTKVVYVTGPLYFGTSNKLSEKLSHLEVDDGGKLIFSMRGVPIADISGVQAMKELCDSLSARKIEIYFSCVQPAVDEMFHRCGLIETYGEERFFWSTDKAMKFIAGETANVCPVCSANASNTAVTAETASV